MTGGGAAPIPLKRRWRAETRRVWVWWCAGLIWLAVLYGTQTVSRTAALLSTVWSDFGAIFEIAGLWIAFVAAFTVLPILTWWLLRSFERGSVAARPVFQVIFVGLGVIRIFSSIVKHVSPFTWEVNVVTSAGELAAWAYAAWLLQKIPAGGPSQHNDGSSGTLARVRTELPAVILVAAVVLLFILAGSGGSTRH